MRHLVALALTAALVLTACTAGAPGEPDPARPEEAADPPAREGPATPEPDPPAATPAPGTPVATVPPDADRPPGQAGLGVTAEPCPAAVNTANGCIYLGALEDLGRLDRARLGSPAGQGTRVGIASSEARRAFWQRVNERGGIAGYDVDASTYTRDTGADPDAGVLALTELRSEVLALAASQGLEATAAILPSLRELPMAAVASTATSVWAATAEVHTVGSTACVDAANGVDHALDRAGAGAAVAVVHQPGAFGEDAAAGAALAAGRRGSPLRALALPGPAAQPDAAVAVAEVAADVLEARPRIVVVAAGAPELAALADRLAAGRFDGTLVTLAAGWDERLAARLPAAVASDMLVVGPWAPWNAGTPGHAALRAALREALEDDDELEPREAHVAGWAHQYPLAAALEAALAAVAGERDPTPADVLRALHDVDDLASDGMLPPGTPDAPATAHSVLSAVDPEAPTGLTARTGHVAGASARALDLTQPCPSP